MRHHFRCGNDGAIRRRWRKNTVGRWHMRRGGNTADNQVPVCLNLDFSWALSLSYTYTVDTTSINLRLAQNLFFAPDLPRRNYCITRGAVLYDDDGPLGRDNVHFGTQYQRFIKTCCLNLQGDKSSSFLWDARKVTNVMHRHTCLFTVLLIASPGTLRAEVQWDSFLLIVKMLFVHPTSYTWQLKTTTTAMSPVATSSRLVSQKPVNSAYRRTKRNTGVLTSP